MQTMKNSVFLSLAAALCVIAEPALAHDLDAQGGGFGAGLAHPFSGIDHLLAMVAVGLWASQLGGRAVWAVPLSFFGAMLAGSALALAGIGMPHVEAGIATSVVLFGLLVGTSARMSVWASITLVSLFAAFHGHAHAKELPQAASAAAYGGGFSLATMALLALGVGIGEAAKGTHAIALRAMGTGVAATGIALLLSM